MSNLNLNKAYMLERAYYNYIDRISVHLREASDFFVRRSLDAEVAETYKNQLRKKGMDDETIEEKAKEVKKKELTELVGLDVAYDMGWQKCSSGRRYDSKSGHAFLIGLITNKIIGVVVFCKDCRKCMEAEKKGVPPEPHANCPRNYNNSSKAMESDGAVKLVLQIHNQYNKMVCINHFLGNNDSTTRSLLLKKTDKNNGKLPEDYPLDLTFWADVNHCVKCMQAFVCTCCIA